MSMSAVAREETEDRHKNYPQRTKKKKKDWGNSCDLFSLSLLATAQSLEGEE